MSATLVDPIWALALSFRQANGLVMSQKMASSANVDIFSDEATFSLITRPFAKKRKSMDSQIWLVS